MQCRRTICDGAERGWRRITKQSEEHGAEKLLRRCSMVTFDHITFELKSAVCAALSSFTFSPKSWPRGPARDQRSSDLIRIQNLSPPSTARTKICDQRPCRVATPTGRPRPHRLTASPLASSRSCRLHLRASCRGEVALLLLRLCMPDGLLYLSYTHYTLATQHGIISVLWSWSPELLAQHDAGCTCR